MDAHNKLKWVSGSRTPSKTYITRVLNFGTWEEWRELRKRYSLRRIQEAVKHPLRGEWTPKGKMFAETVFNCRIPKNALISYEA